MRNITSVTSSSDRRGMILQTILAIVCLTMVGISTLIQHQARREAHRALVRSIGLRHAMAVAESALEEAMLGLRHPREPAQILSPDGDLSTSLKVPVTRRLLDETPMPVLMTLGSVQTRRVGTPVEVPDQPILGTLELSVDLAFKEGRGAKVERRIFRRYGYRIHRVFFTRNGQRVPVYSSLRIEPTPLTQWITSR